MTDHLHGWKAFADHLGLGVSAVRHIHRHDPLPVYRLGKTVAGSRAALDKWRQQRIAKAEAEAAEAQRKAEAEAAAKKDGAK